MVQLTLGQIHERISEIDTTRFQAKQPKSLSSDEEYRSREIQSKPSCMFWQKPLHQITENCPQCYADRQETMWERRNNPNEQKQWRKWGLFRLSRIISHLTHRPMSFASSKAAPKPLRHSAGSSSDFPALPLPRISRTRRGALCPDIVEWDCTAPDPLQRYSQQPGGPSTKPARVPPKPLRVYLAPVALSRFDRL